jgi:hypothetical protein
VGTKGQVMMKSTKGERNVQGAAKKRRRNRADNVNLSEFIRTNPSSKVRQDAKKIVIELPWNDASLELTFRGPRLAGDAACLNLLVLPERFNAIYHRDRRCIEYIFSDLFDTDDPMPSQKFAFRWGSHDYRCHYGPASDRLLFLARAFRPLRSSGSFSDYRHLEQLHDFQLQDKLPKELRDFYKSQVAISFFVNDVENYDEELFVDLAKHLNFYLSYFDRSSPQIDIVASVPPSAPNAARPQKPEIVPPLITAVDLDPFLLDLNLAAKVGSARLRILYYYQILEYAAFYWVEDSVKSAICRILQAPDLQSNLDEYFPKLIEALVPTRQNDEHKIRRVIECRVDPKIIWSEISLNLDYFSTGHTFEGGFRLEPVVSADTTEEAFSKMWSPKLFETIRAVRNSLVHARESRTEAVISPTINNSRLLTPWIPVVRRMAEFVTIYDR